MGRVVITHSTYIAGLIKILEKIGKNDEIKTIIPGSISRSKGSTEKLNMRITRSVSGGYKLLARKGKSVQEVYVITDINEVDLKLLIEENL